VAQANDRMRSGRLLTPSGGNAREALLEARRLDPTDPTVQQSIREFGGILIDEARSAQAAGKPEEAQLLAGAARQFGAAGAALTAVERSLSEASRAASARTAAARQLDATIDAMITDIRGRIGAGKLIEPAGDSARDHLGKLVAAAPGRPEIEELARALSTRLVDSGRQAMTAKAFDRSAQLVTAAREVGGRYNDDAIVQVERELAAAREAYARETNIVSVSTLKRTRMVDPVYPDAALKRSIEGWIELNFTVQPNGGVTDVEVRNASPAGVFDDAAIRAVRGWRFEPAIHNGEKVAQRAMVRLKFALPD
jgi:protein TonB